MEKKNGENHQLISRFPCLIVTWQFQGPSCFYGWRKFSLQKSMHAQACAAPLTLEEQT